MGWRFYRRVRLFPGLTVNLSRSGPSVSVGIRGAHVTLGPKGLTRTVGLPGSGLFYTSRTGWQNGNTAPSTRRQSPAIVIAFGIILAMILAALLA